MEEKKEMCCTDNDIDKLIEGVDKLNIKKKIVTEDLGKIFEMAICKLYNIDYDGKYKYSMEEAEKLKTRISKLKLLFPYNLKHTAKRGSRYDFTIINDNKENKDLYLSAKTSKGDDKICPQVIGQPSKKKFCEYFKISLETNIKSYIITNIKNLLSSYEDTTFDSPIIYYNKEKDKAILIRQIEKINWNSNLTINFSHIMNKKEWNESTSLYLVINDKQLNIGEFQIHNKRNCIKFRWNIENILNHFKDNFIVTLV